MAESERTRVHVRVRLQPSFFRTPVSVPVNKAHYEARIDVLAHSGQRGNEDGVNAGLWEVMFWARDLVKCRG